jgi:hypothetical protein
MQQFHHFLGKTPNQKFKFIRKRLVKNIDAVALLVVLVQVVESHVLLLRRCFDVDGEDGDGRASSDSPVSATGEVLDAITASTFVRVGITGDAGGRGRICVVVLAPYFL